MENVEKAWKQKCNEDVLERSFQTLEQIWKEIIACNGNNSYETPHFRGKEELGLKN